MAIVQGKLKVNREVQNLLELRRLICQKANELDVLEKVYIRTDIVEADPISDRFLQRTYHPRIIVEYGNSRFSCTLQEPLIRNCGDETANRLDAVVRAYEMAIGLVNILLLRFNGEKIRINELPITNVEEQRNRYSQELSDLVNS